MVSCPEHVKRGGTTKARKKKIPAGFSHLQPQHSGQIKNGRTKENAQLIKINWAFLAVRA
jgi:hypothetical protein